MHIINNIKWFKKDTFRPFNNYIINISTANRSTTLKVKGGGIAQVILKCLNGFLVTVSLLEVAYTP